MASIKEMSEKRAKIITNAQTLNAENRDAETGLLSNEHQAEFETMMADAANYASQIKAQKELLSQESNLAEVVEQIEAQRNEPSQPQTYQVRQGFNANGTPRYINIEGGKRASDEYRANYLDSLMGSNLAPERRAALQSDDAAQAGYLVASEQFAAGMLKEVDDLLFIRQYANIHTVREAGSLGIRKRTARMSTWAWSSELQVSTEDSTLAYGKKVLEPHAATGLIKVSRDLLRRSMGGAESEISSEMARDSGELMEDGYLTGTGSQSPLGVFTASSDGISTSRDVDTGSTTSYTFAGLMNAKYTLKSQYRRGPGCRWLFHRDGISKIAQLVDTDNQPIFRVGAGVAFDSSGNHLAGGQDTLLGFPVDESERAPNTFTAALYVGLLANWRYYEIADALDMETQRLDELYAATNQVGFIGRLKTDGMPTLEEAFVRCKTDAS